MAKFVIVDGPSVGWSRENVIVYQFWCPGCEAAHTLDSTWTYDGNLENPTIDPSYLTSGGRHKPGKGFPHDTEMFVCHSFIKNGHIQFLGDCTHLLKNSTVPLPDYII